MAIKLVLVSDFIVGEIVSFFFESGLAAGGVSMTLTRCILPELLFFRQLFLGVDNYLNCSIGMPSCSLGEPSIG